MQYYFNKKIAGNFDETVKKVTESLAAEGFGVLTEIDVKTIFKKKLGQDFYNYKILGACNPPYAYKALLAEDKIGTMLPCNVVVQEQEPGQIEISAIDPTVSMKAVLNKDLQPVAEEIAQKLRNVINGL
ncbi:MAG TPA: DUF302 domain-containing protein [Chitinophagaceae bacterium]|jgi:uncharacterized protein (DUF302 family)|nr:DUF302 domain-containing protein [Chitinophagaceae bacterium]